ncbi:flagellar motor switch protein FliG [Desulfosarcina sp. OttesenSCG-928-G10]|nr:flagellar motor switch protein FliG [Desulfosarcina sp. OttesenSCG-928-G10]
MDPRNLIGSIKAAILIRSLGWDRVAPIINDLTLEEQDRIFKLQSRLGDVAPALVDSVVREFIESATDPRPIQIPATEASADAPPTPSEAQKLKAIESIAPEMLVQLLQNEHPQTIALVIAHLKPSAASQAMALLEDEIRPNVAYRIATLDKVTTGMMEEINQVLEEILSNKDASTTQKAGGIPKLAEILNLINSAATDEILEEIGETDPEMAEMIRRNMFVFDDLVLVDDRGLQKVLRSVDSQELAIALKATTDEVKEKIFKNMSQRAAEILKEEMSVSGAVRIKDVTDAQQKITKIAQEMERRGELVIAGRGGEEFVG